MLLWLLLFVDEEDDAIFFMSLSSLLLLKIMLLVLTPMTIGELLRERCFICTLLLSAREDIGHAAVAHKIAWMGI
jgi:hypothetical protein